MSDALWRNAQARTRVLADGNVRLKSGGMARYLLSGLLRCDRCGSHFVLASAFSYACGGHLNGTTCSNAIRVRSDTAEDTILGPVREDLLAPKRVQAMAREMERAYAERLLQAQARSDAAPRELQEFDARLARLRARAASGDPDLTADDLQAAIDRVEAKRQELQAAQPQVRRSAKLRSILPKAAELYRRQIAAGLDGDPAETTKARLILRELFAGEILLEPGEDGSLWARYALHPAALLQACGTDGRGERI